MEGSVLKVVQIGIGPLGQKVVRYALERKGVKIVAAVDKDPSKIGEDLGLLCSTKRLGVRSAGISKTALKGKKADVAVLTTVSSVKKLVGQVEEIAKAKLHVVSTCEELSFPWKANAAAAKKIDRLCRKHGVACLGTGVNPGFLMDYLPSVQSSVCQKVKRVKVTRVQDASSRRIPFQQKIGAGLTRAQFEAKVKEGTVRHVGLEQSIHMIAASLGWTLSRTTESLVPVIAKRVITSGYTRIRKGDACGIEQVGRGYVKGKEVIELHFRAAVGEKESFDRVEIFGEPNIQSTISGGVNGDVATCAITVNALRSIVKSTPGLKTMLDIPVPGCFSAV